MRVSIHRPLAAAAALCLALAAPAAAQERSSMEERLSQIIGAIQEAPSCEAASGALDHVLEVLYGGARPLPSRDKDGPGETAEITERADAIVSQRERRMAEALQGLAFSDRCPDLAGRALDLKIFVEQMNEVALAVARATRECVAGMSLEEPPCDQLAPVLDEDIGREPRNYRGPKVIRPGFVVKLRGPFLPGHGNRWHEDVVPTEPLRPGECVAIMKETRGLMLRLKYAGFTIVRDPWATPELARGTRIPIWTLEWIPSEYIKLIQICNRDGRIQRSHSQRVIQDEALNYFWRYFGPPHGRKHGGRHH